MGKNGRKRQRPVLVFGTKTEHQKDDNRKRRSGYQFIAWKSKRKLTQNIPGINPVFSPAQKTIRSGIAIL